MIYLDFNNINEADKESVVQALNEGQISTSGKYVEQFEQAIGEKLGTNHVFASNSGTSAMHLALLSAGIRRGDEVLVPALSFIASANVIRYVGARPVFVDVDPDTWCIDVKKARARIRKRTRAILPVHLYGNPCDMQAIWNLATFERLTIIADAAASLGATYGDKVVEKWGHYSCVSFNGNKSVTTGGGGLVVCLNEKTTRHVNKLGRQGMDDSVVSYNYRMTSLSAALGLSQLERAEEFFRKKRRFNQIYQNELSHLIKFQRETPNSIPSWWYTAGTYDSFEDTSFIIGQLKQRGVPIRRVFFPLPFTKAHYDNGYYPNAQYIFRHGLCLPTSTMMEEKDVMYCCKEIKGVL